MSFNVKSSFIGIVEDQNVFADPGTNLTEAKIRLVGICNSESGYKITPDETQRASYGEDVTASYKNEINVAVITKLQTATKTALEGGRCSLIFLDPSQWNVTEAELHANDVLDAANSIGANFDYTILKPCKLTVEEDVKFGSGKVSQIIVKATVSEETVAELVKEGNKAST